VDKIPGFAKQDDIPCFLARLVKGYQYVYLPQLAPIQQILIDYRADSKSTIASSPIR
jgi:hypothetical protein